MAEQDHTLLLSGIQEDHLIPLPYVYRGGRGKDLTGNVYNRLTVLGMSSRRDGNRMKWVCKCECGKVVSVRTSHLLGGKIQSCGCYQKEIAVQRAYDGDGVVKKTHGLSRSRIYTIYRAMIQRCYDSSVTKYFDYGGRGIKVCDRWRGPGGFERWLEDMKDPPSSKHSIDRIDVNGDYSPENCRWVTAVVQMRNMRTNRYVEWEGKKRLLIELAEEYGIPYKQLHKRVFTRGWDLRRALLTPLRPFMGRQRGPVASRLHLDAGD